MAAGTVQTIVICAPSAFSQAPCPSGQAISTMQAFVLDPAYQASFNALTEPFDYAVAGQFFMFGFTTVMSFWLLGIAVGAIVNRVKRA